MWPTWWRRWQARRQERVLQSRPIPDALWHAVLDQFPFLRQRPAEDVEELRRLATLFLDRKEFTGAGGLTITDEMAVAIAAQACLPVLKLGLHLYDDFVGIVVHPDEVVARREVMDEDGVVHHYDEVLAGEAMDRGPVMLSWRDVREAGACADWAYNVVIHEFVHKLDMQDGESDGVPPLPPAARAAWIDVIDAEFERFCADVDEGRETFLDPYGAQGCDEFFAVAAEAFFVAPLAFRAEHPALYEQFKGYFQQDPAATAAGP
ncbi:zinc-dependent peptidase [Schlegelella aquatica]|uniref:M90 family metallopeptidase n=1 Tax=Caldimonas aquatica TaxID=376175 RepID=UPI0037518D18